MESLTALHDLISKLIVPHRRNSSINLVKRLVADIWAVRLELRLACLLDGIAINEDMAIILADGMKELNIYMLKVSMESALRAGLAASLHRPIEQASQNCKSSLQVQMLSLLHLTVGVGIWVDIQLEHLPGPVMSALETCELAFGQTQASNRVIVELEPASTIILSGPLKVVQVDLLHLTQSEKLQDFLPSRHQLMAFSFPALFDSPGSNLELDKLIERLKHQIQDKLRSVGCTYGWEEVEIRVEQTVNLERVAL
ncbi:hypothetical protein MJO29_009770 [Puccinia striiformis f. sp. tritici]|uniref:Uncharacterized protein n=1 Tax=Puccinia striiformis TaxID=27350 RepID=A0A2S4VQQ3_9BASI|nr:hypothetical protein MJO29_009770 [Puccinia striiformis f. sp. tritici]POW11874.1 hypothetical protein PSTT_04921 [Puccinia striiformis]